MTKQLGEPIDSKKLWELVKAKWFYTEDKRPSQMKIRRVVAVTDISEALTKGELDYEMPIL